MVITAICSYQPRPGREEVFRELLAGHVPTLQRLSLATPFAAVQRVSASSGAVIEIFEWRSKDHAIQAHDHPEVQRLWRAMAEVCEFIPLNALTETSKPFAHFFPFDDE